MPTTITLDARVRDRLKRYGNAGMTYDDILQGLMDRIDEEDFVTEMRRRAEELDQSRTWVAIEDA